MKKTITYDAKEYKGRVCPCHRATIWPESTYDAHIERVRQIQSGEFDPYKAITWRQRRNDTISREKKRKADLESGGERLENAF